jgi:hypothetical protein
MLRILRCSFYAALLSMLATGVPAFAANTTAPPKTFIAQSMGKLRVRRSAKVPRTPYERIFAPGVERSVKANGVESKGQRARPAVAAAEEMSANFAGYPAGSLFTACPAPMIGTGVCNASAFVAADFNQDGKQDIAYFTPYGIYPYGGIAELTVLNVALGDGKGGFAAPIVTGGGDIGAPPVTTFQVFDSTAVAADLNGDGYPDIAVMYYGGPVAGNSEYLVFVYFNQKDGTFSAPVQAAFGPPLPPHSSGELDYTFTIGDVNGDGLPDIVMVGSVDENYNPGVPNLVVATFLGTGGGKFTNASGPPQLAMLTLPIVLSGRNIVLADLNGDGRMDLIFQEEASSISPDAVSLTAAYALGNGDGSFNNIGAGLNQVISASVSSMTNFSIDSSGVRVADLNNDGHPDILMDLNGTVYAALGHGDGTFASQIVALSAPPSAGLTVADMNGDGKLDLIQTGGVYLAGCNCSSSYVAIFLGIGNGTFNPQGSYALSAGSNVNAADFNGDGKPDVVMANGDGDGSLDVRSLDAQEGMVLLGNGDGTLAGTPMLAWNATPVELQLMATGDINGDGYTDVILNKDGNPTPSSVAAGQNDLVTGLSDGKGNFTYKHALSAAANADLGYIEPTTADFNGDGKQDILFVGADNTLSVALSRGDGTFADPVSVGLPALQCEVTYSPAGDLNGDGKMDIVATYPGDASCGGSGSMPSGVFVLLGKGDGTFTLIMFCPLGSELYSAALADFNGDGKLDLLVDDTPYNVSGTFRVSLFLGNGDGTFQTEAKQVSTGYAVSQMIAGDFNQDGKMDLMLLTAGDQGLTSPTFATAGVLLLPGNGDGTFGNSTTLVAGNFFSTGTFEDVNGDGIPDLTLAQESFDPSVGSFLALATLLGAGNGTFSNPISTYLPSNPSIIPSEDFNIVLPGNFYADNAPDFVVGTPTGPALFLGRGGSAMRLTASAASIVSGSAETVTATVTPSMSGRPTPTGQVTFYDGTTMLGQSSLSGGMVSFTSSSLSVGSHTISATYGGDSDTNANSATAGSITVTALVPAFSVSASPSSLTITQGQSGTATLTVTANAAYSGTVKFSCGGLPANASCTFTPASLQLSASQTASETMVINTSAPSANAQVKRLGLVGPSAGIVVAGLFLLVLPVRRRGAKTGVLIAALTLSLVIVSGCGSGSTMTASPSVPGTPMGQSTVKVTVVDSVSSSSQTATIVLVIQ